MSRPGIRPLDPVSLFAMSAPGAAVPFLSVLRALDSVLSSWGVVYAVIGGVAAARAGGFRTTGDIDILVEETQWKLLTVGTIADFEIGPDWAKHLPSDVTVDVLFAGDDWNLPFLLPQPKDVREWDNEVGAWFITPAGLLRLKVAVYLTKLTETLSKRRYAFNGSVQLQKVGEKKW